MDLRHGRIMPRRPAQSWDIESQGDIDASPMNRRDKRWRRSRDTGSGGDRRANQAARSLRGDRAS
jgi:hypothetical protein